MDDPRRWIKSPLLVLTHQTIIMCWFIIHDFIESGHGAMNVRIQLVLVDRGHPYYVVCLTAWISRRKRRTIRNTIPTKVSSLLCPVIHFNCCPRRYDNYAEPASSSFQAWYCMYCSSVFSLTNDHPVQQSCRVTRV